MSPTVFADTLIGGLNHYRVGNFGQAPDSLRKALQLLDQARSRVQRVGDVTRIHEAVSCLAEAERHLQEGPINTVIQALADVQAQHRGMVRTLAGMPVVGAPVRLDGARADSELPPPGLGQHTDEVLASLGVQPSRLEQLRSDGVIG